MSIAMNRTVLMSGANHFDDAAPINPFMNKSIPVDREAAQAEHSVIRAALQNAGVNVVQVEPPINCQDGVYTANWALVRGDTALIARLPNARKAEEAYATQVLRDLGKTILTAPDELRFSGQGDCLPCGNYLFAGTGYRTDKAMHDFVADSLGYEVISLQTVPKRSLFGYGKPVINKYSGWPDSFFYDIDLALSVLQIPSNEKRGLIAWCPDAFVPQSQEILRNFDGVDKIEISLVEAKESFACNLVSTGTTVIMSDKAPVFEAELQSRGFKTVTPAISELLKGGGYIRCTTLTLDNE